MKIYKVMFMASAFLAFVFFILMIGFIGGIESGAISFSGGLVGSLAALVLWVLMILAADCFSRGGL